jgi:hypothetical protein
LIIVFISTTRVATLIRRRRNVSNCTTRHIERLGIDTRRPNGFVKNLKIAALKYSRMTLDLALLSSSAQPETEPRGSCDFAARRLSGDLVKLASSNCVIAQRITFGTMINIDCLSGVCL